MVRYRHIQTGLLILVILVGPGCATYSLREAQDHFNKASAIELRALDRTLLSDNPDASPGDAVSALNEYRLAGQEATALIDQKSSDLKKDNLLGPAYVLKAMALWRISDLEGNQTGGGEETTEQSGRRAAGDSRKTESEPVADSGGPKAGQQLPPRQQLLDVLDQIKTLQSENEITLDTRDRALWAALYGFYDHDGGRMEQDYMKARKWFESAHNRLKEALNGVPAGHPVRVYIGFAQLRTMAAWNLATYNAPKAQSCDSECKKSVGVDKNEIKNKAKDVACDLSPFWADNRDLKLRLDLFLAAVGHPGAADKCP